MQKALFCGLTTIDITQKVQNIPTVNEKVVATDTLIDVGGPAANAARIANALGINSTLITLLGKNEFAKLAQRQLEAEGITVIDLALDDDFPVSTVLVDTKGLRSVASKNNGGRKFILPNLAVLKDINILEIDGHLPEIQKFLAIECKTHNIPVVFDGGSWKETTATLLPLITYAILSADFTLPNSTKDIFTALAPYKYPLLAQSSGEKPTRVKIADEQIQHITIPQVKTEDTLGAGDVLHGAFTAFLSYGYQPLIALNKATKIASISTTKPGILGWKTDENTPKV